MKKIGKKKTTAIGFAIGGMFLFLSGVAYSDDIRTVCEHQYVEGNEGDNGVKGMIKNFSGDSIDVKVWRGWGMGWKTVCDLHHHEAMPYLDGRIFDGRAGVHSVKVTTWNPDHSQYHEIEIEIEDPFLGYPSTRVSFYSSKNGTLSMDRLGINYREKWKEGESHHEIWGGMSIWIKREFEPWHAPQGENEHTEDWAVFTIHVDKL